MATHANSIPAPARRLLRAAGPCRVLTTADVLARAAPSLVDITTAAAVPLGATRDHTRVLRQHDASTLPRASEGLFAGVGLRRHGQLSRSVLTAPLRVRA